MKKRKDLYWRCRSIKHYDHLIKHPVTVRRTFYPLYPLLLLLRKISLGVSRGALVRESLPRNEIAMRGCHVAHHKSNCRRNATSSRGCVANFAFTPRERKSRDRAIYGLFSRRGKQSVPSKTRYLRSPAFKRPFAALPTLRPVLSPTKRRGTPGRPTAVNRIGVGRRSSKINEISGPAAPNFRDSPVRDVPASSLGLTKFRILFGIIISALPKLLINFEFNFATLPDKIGDSEIQQ